MAINRNKFVVDVRKIVNIDPAQSVLPPAVPRSTIESVSGIAFVTPDGANTKGATVATGKNTGNSLQSWLDYMALANNLPAAKDTGSGQNTDPTDPNSAANKDGSKNDPRRGITSITKGDQGTYPIKDIIDGEKGIPFIPDWVPKGLAQYYLRNGGTLNGITGAYDCTTASGLDIRMDGLMRPPPGWYTADTPTLDPGDPLYYLNFNPGKQWVGFPGSFIDVFPLGAAQQARDFAGDSDKTNLLSTNYISLTDIWQFTWENPSSHATATYQANGQTCTPSHDDPTCPLVNPIKWPGDGKMQMVKNKDGTFKAAIYESPTDLITKYTDNIHSRLDFCFDAGRKGSIIPAINGGYMITETLTEGGTPTGIVKLFDSSNKVVAYLDATNYTNYLAR
jgi:hypothetical protein